MLDVANDYELQSFHQNFSGPKLEEESLQSHPVDSKLLCPGLDSIEHFGVHFDSKITILNIIIYKK